MMLMMMMMITVKRVWHEVRESTNV